MRLAGDIGGTHARLELLGPGGRAVRREDLDSRAFPSLQAALRAFLGPRPPSITHAAFGVAGPVVDGRCVATNLPWVVDARALGRALGARHVTVMNDLVALSLGAIGVPRSKLRPLGAAGLPRRRGGNVAVLAAGTGLGEAVLVWDGARFVPTATEGGHVDFAPRDDLEVALFRFLKGRYPHVSYERVVSGMGLGNLYDFFREAEGVTETREVERALAQASDRNAAISAMGAKGESVAASRAVDLFARIYGAEAGNLALKSLARGGVLVCGNIAAKLLPVLERGGFMEAFLDKGRMRAVLEAIPVAVVLEPDAGLLGARRAAME